MIKQTPSLATYIRSVDLLSSYQASEARPLYRAFEDVALGPVRRGLPGSTTGPVTGETAMRQKLRFGLESGASRSAVENEARPARYSVCHRLLLVVIGGDGGIFSIRSTGPSGGSRPALASTLEAGLRISESILSGKYAL